jgi:hypothetical protein
MGYRNQVGQGTPRGKGTGPATGSHDWGAFGVINSPAEPLEELRGGVLVAHVLRADVLVEQDPMLVASTCVCRDDDPRHRCTSPFLGEPPRRRYMDTDVSPPQIPPKRVCATGLVRIDEG